jgi:preprotein translocase subunit SecA
MEDPLMRLFASDNVKNMMRTLGMEKGESIEHRMVTGAIEKAQKKVEGRNYDMRKSLLEYDDVANDQRQVIYQQRNELLEEDDISEIIERIREDVVDVTISFYLPPQSLVEQWDIPELEKQFEKNFDLKIKVQDWLEDDDLLNEESIRSKIQHLSKEAYAKKVSSIGADIRMIERQLMLQVLDTLWKEHLSRMDYLRQGINLRAYAQKNPRQEYKRESFELFQQMLENIKLETIRFLSKAEVRSRQEIEQLERTKRENQQKQNLKMQHDSAPSINGSKPRIDSAKNSIQTKPFVRSAQKVGRNDPCPCGNGKKFKQCCGKLK